jgi:hypothetical protein
MGTLFHLAFQGIGKTPLISTMAKDRAAGAVVPISIPKLLLSMTPNLLVAFASKKIGLDLDFYCDQCLSNPGATEHSPTYSTADFPIEEFLPRPQPLLHDDCLGQQCDL